MLLSTFPFSTAQPQRSEGPSVPDFLAVFCTPPAPGLPGEPVFLLKRLLKKLANTPSLAALSKETEKRTLHKLDELKQK